MPLRTVAYKIIDAAEADVTSPDCTGTVDEDGVHGVGKGTPPCTAMVRVCVSVYVCVYGVCVCVFVCVSVDPWWSWGRGGVGAWGRMNV